MSPQNEYRSLMLRKAQQVAQQHGGISKTSSKARKKTFGKYLLQVSEENPTMDDFWIMQGWYKEGKNGIRLIRAKWQEDEEARTEAVRFLVEQVIKKDPRDIAVEDFRSNRLGGLLTDHYSNSPYEVLLRAGAVTPEDEAYMRSNNHAKQKE